MILINLSLTPLDDHAEILIRMDAADCVPLIVENLLNKDEI
jgi:NAD-dependent SIR2 family protein deacetylase